MGTGGEDSQAIHQRMEQLSGALVLAEPSDLQALAELHTGFEQVNNWAQQAAQPKLAAAATSAAKLVESVILEEVEDATAALETVAATVVALQQVIRDGRPAGEINFPLVVDTGQSDGNSEALSDGSATCEQAPLSLPANVDEQILSQFLERQRGEMEEFEALVLALEGTDHQGQLAALRRQVHTLKGDAALLGLADVERLCHAAEDALNERPPHELVDPLLAVRDWLSRTFASYAGQGQRPGPVEEVFTPLAVRADAVADHDATPDANQDRPSEDIDAVAASQHHQSQSQDEPSPQPLEADPALLSDFVIESREHLDAADAYLLTLETEPRDTEAVNALFRVFHTIKGVAGFLGLAQIGTLAHESENLLDQLRKGKLTPAGHVMDVTFDAVDALKGLVEGLCEALRSGQPMAELAALPDLVDRIRSAASEQPPPWVEQPGAAQSERIGDILIESGHATPEAVEDALRQQRESRDPRPLGELLVSRKQAAAKDVAAALRAQRMAQLQGVKVAEAVKVDADRLDRLVDAIGELVIAESMVVQSVALTDGTSSTLGQQLNQLGKITRELQEMGTSLRMVPVRATFQKMARVVRDLSRKSGKPVEFVMSGEDTELDKSVVDRIGDPLVHMVRNAVDHGIEAHPQQRQAAGKPEAGCVKLRAFHKGGNIFIEIEDDGRGVDRNAIFAKAAERGLIRTGESLSDREVFSLIFQPGFSTAEKVTDVSGRGVGMDVVKRNIESLRGQVEIQSEMGKGSVFSIRLPLTLAIIDGMVVAVGTERYIIPTLSIRRSIRPESGDITTILNRGEALSIQEALIPLVRLDALLNIEHAKQDVTEALVVVVEDGGHQTGLVVDDLLGQQQIVIKSLGEAMKGTPGVAGGAIMRDGHVGLILDVGGLVRLANSDTPAQHPEAV
ncbi:MAG TPA: chemotaxis protein CheA [Phycisphaerae bacterium]|nr:chemotaxis protein CheA [Phycisphaerae bacterium]